ncbi:MAG: ribosome recycling factor [Bdellovibrio sp.]|nr:ribosome recycling factor [Bdellovibrio sp.]
MSKDVIDLMVQGMEKSLQSLKTELSKLRTGRASTALMDPIKVDYYGSSVPVNQVGNVTTPDARTIQITPWETQIIGAIEKAILAANIGFTPQNDGKIIRISLPQMTEERRKELVKLVKKIGEDSKVSLRNQRREANEEIKKREKAKQFSEDDAKKTMDQIQKKTDEKAVEVDKIMTAKEKEIMTV